MSTEETQEVEATETTEVVEQKKTLDQLSQEELVDYVKTLRTENAKHRTAKQAKEAELEEFRAWKESQKSEIEKANERAETAEKDRLTLLRENAALAAGLDDDLTEFVTGSTREEIRASAMKLAGKTTPTKKVGASDVFAGNRGEPVNSGPKDTKTLANDYMAALIWGQRN
ncbi:hypothetical protein ACFP2T_35710 [Plantactinospora solaniradicis]|uniref:DUF4355 domain-containing protein n=1 Tax=Plantactinospora solaniradicis TaxID=1723736 RepID=A0ABW1KM05_9ACTN